MEMTKFEVIFHFECVDDVGECGAPLKNKIKFIIEFKNDDWCNDRVAL